jgi:hypothetical protein
MLHTKITGSSNLSAAAWRDEMLFIQFHHGGWYSYTGVPQQVFHDLVNAPSAGKFFHAAVKPSFPSVNLRIEEVRALGLEDPAQ